MISWKKPVDVHALFVPTTVHRRPQADVVRVGAAPAISRAPAPVERYFDVAPDARVLAHCHFGGKRRAGRSTNLILLHGLEGSSMAHYMRGIADKAWAAGWDVIRLNQRNCGGTERLSRGLYHSGLTHDVRHVMRELIEVDRVPAVAVAGYSLGGNLTLKLAGELGEASPPQLIGVVRDLTGDGPAGMCGSARAALKLRVRVEFRP
jgi:predicted alpha/beta-fold hydrolase